MRKTGLLLGVAVTALALGGCTNSQEPSPQPRTLDAVQPGQPTVFNGPPGAPQTAAPAAAKECTAEDVQVTEQAGQPHVVIGANCLPPHALVSKTLRQGSGEEARSGGTVTLNYLVLTLSDKQEKETTFGKQPVQVKVGNGNQAAAIPLTEETLKGIKEGERRVLIVPAAQGFPQGKGPIKPGETLVYVLDAVTVG